jgi:casein kinase 1
MAKHMPAENMGDMENVLQDLAQLHLGDRQILGDRKNIASAVRNTQNHAKKEDTVEKPAVATKIIEISSSSEGSIPLRSLTPKAHKLIKLTKALSGASDNEAIAGTITEFIAVLQINGSRNMTKEGFAFLDALHKQLADPSVFIKPLRTSRKRSADKEQVPEAEPRHVKLGVVARLKREVAVADGNEILAEMIAEFGAVTNRGSSGRTVTKDGFAFLRGLAARLRDLDRDKIRVT